MTKSQKKVIKRVNNYLNHGKRAASRAEGEKGEEGGETGESGGVGREIIPEGVCGASNVGVDDASRIEKESESAIAESKSKRTKVMAESNACDKASAEKEDCDIKEGEGKVSSPKKSPRPGK